MIIHLMRLIPQEDKRQAVLKILQSIVPTTLAKPGCLDSSIFQEYDSAHSILYSEQWSSEEELYTHIQSQQFLRILTTMDMAESTPEISFHSIARTSHMELIDAIRRKV